MHSLRGAAGVWLHIDTPGLRVEVEGFQSSHSTELLELIDPLVTAIVAVVWQTLRVLVREDGTVGLHGRTARQVLKSQMSTDLMTSSSAAFDTPPRQ